MGLVLHLVGARLEIFEGLFSGLLFSNCWLCLFSPLFAGLQTKEKYYKGIGHALGTIAKDEGLRGLYKGMGATLLVSESGSFFSFLHSLARFLLYPQYAILSCFLRVQPTRDDRREALKSTPECRRVYSTSYIDTEVSASSETSVDQRVRDCCKMCEQRFWDPLQ